VTGGYEGGAEDAGEAMYSHLGGCLCVVDVAEM
jgi:hypothetical protein